MHRRLAFISTVSAADVIRLPNRAGFGIQGGIAKHWRDGHRVNDSTVFGSFMYNMDRNDI